MSANTANQETFRIKYLDVPKDLKDTMAKTNLARLTIPTDAELKVEFKEESRKIFRRAMYKVLITFYDRDSYRIGNLEMKIKPDQYQALKDKRS